MKKFNITKQTFDACKEFLDGYKKDCPDMYNKVIGINGILSFEKCPSVWAEGITTGEGLISSLKILKDKNAVAQYFAFYDKKGKIRDNWLSVIG